MEIKCRLHIPFLWVSLNAHGQTICKKTCKNVNSFHIFYFSSTLGSTVLQERMKEYWRNNEKILIGFQTSAMLILILREQEMVWKVMEGEGGSYSSIWKSQQKPRWWKWNTLLQKSDFKKSKIFRKIKSISFKPKIVYEHNTFLKFSFRKF